MTLVVLFVFIATLLAFCSFGINLFTALALLLKKHVRNSFNLYFGLISLADCIIAVVFILTNSPILLAEQFNIVYSATIYYVSIILTLYAVKVSICFQSIHTLMAGLEKFATICKPSCNFSSCARIFLCVIAVVFSLFRVLFSITVLRIYIYTRPLLTFVLLIMLIIAISTCKRQNEEHRGSKSSDMMEVLTLIATLITFSIFQTSDVVALTLVNFSEIEFKSENVYLLHYVSWIHFFTSSFRILIYLGISPSLRSELLHPCRKQYPADECNDGANIPLQ